MLVVISDLHFVDGTAGRHNLSPEAFSDIFVHDLVALAQRRGATEIKVVLLGDIPDLIRSAHWLAHPLEQRPWGRDGLADVARWDEFRSGQPPTPTERICLDILGRYPAGGRREDVPPDTILYQNWETFAFFRALPQRLHRFAALHGLPVELIFIPGNHDRLVNLYPSLRDAVRDMLGLTVNDQTTMPGAGGEWWYRYTYTDTRYGIFAQHGHQYDPANYGGGNDQISRRAYLQVPLGDVLATEFAVRLPWLAQQRCRRGELSADLVARLQDFDNVRPFSGLFEYFYAQYHDQRAEVARILDALFDEAVTEILNIDFARTWQTPLSGWDEWVWGRRWLPARLKPLLARVPLPGLDEWLRLATRPVPRRALTALLRHTRFDALIENPLVGALTRERTVGSRLERDAYIHGALRHPVWDATAGIDAVVMGHTHVPQRLLLDEVNGRQRLYVNTGTWRERIERSFSLDRVGDFVKLKQMTYVVFYNADENGGEPGGNRLPGTPSFDMWTGSRLKHYR